MVDYCSVARLALLARSSLTHSSLPARLRTDSHASIGRLWLHIWLLYGSCRLLIDICMAISCLNWDRAVVSVQVLLSSRVGWLPSVRSIDLLWTLFHHSIVLLQCVPPTVDVLLTCLRLERTLAGVPTLLCVSDGTHLSDRSVSWSRRSPSSVVGSSRSRSSRSSSIQLWGFRSPSRKSSRCGSLPLVVLIAVHVRFRLPVELVRTARRKVPPWSSLMLLPRCM